MRPRRGAVSRTLLLAALLISAAAPAAAVQEAPETPADLAGELLDQLEQVDSGGSPADSPRRRAMLSAVLAAATLVSEDLTCIAAGLLVARQKLPFAVAAAACFLGIFLGDLLLVFVGRALGAGVVRRWPFSRLLSRSRLETSEVWFRERGARVVFLSRFVPGSRLPLFLAAGVLRAPIAPIALALAVAGALWTPFLVGLSAWTGGAVLRLFRQYERLALPALALAALASWFVLRLVVPLFSWRGRRLLLARWRRLTRWEFWPAWIFQAPVFLNVLRLGWKHGGIGTFTAANPGIPAGGFVEESKRSILEALGDAPVARFTTLARLDAPVTVEARLEALRATMRAAELDFPVVLKPDVGERGFGVAIARSEADAARALAGAMGDWIVQEYIAGEEFGVFYLRHPGDEIGRILSITTKRFPRVVGDGTRPLEELILADDRAVCMAEFYLEVNSHRLASVPGEGEPVQLVEIGNHCRGTVFLDGNEHATPELLAELDRIARGFDGFHFGRFDLRVPSVEHLRAGRGLRILELNGVTSEATHIYHPGASLFVGWRTLFEQWRLAFEIGAANVERGAKRHSVGELLDLLRARRRRFATIPAPSDERGT